MDERLPEGWEVTQKPDPPVSHEYVVQKGSMQVAAPTWGGLMEKVKEHAAAEQERKDQAARELLDPGLTP